MRSGLWVKQATGYRAYSPSPLPPSPSLNLDGEMLSLLSEADQKLGRLNGMAGLLPDQDLFVGFYVKKEAILSSQIEGITCTLEDLFQYNPKEDGGSLTPVGEIVNYVNALNYGIERLSSLPLSLRLIKEVHQHLLVNVRGSQKDPGQFRTSQNWIGPAGCTLATATFVPPPAHDLMKHLGELENFIHTPGKNSLPILVRCALVHGQFETIHPFLDGNGRVGRLLISLMLHDEKSLTSPLLYMSFFLKKNKEDYYKKLTDIREKDDWEGWVKFFLQGVSVVCDDAIQTIESVNFLKKQCHQKVEEMTLAERKAVDFLFTHPILDIRALEKELGCSYNKAANVLRNLEKAGIVQETTGRRRDKTFKFKTYMDLFEPGLDEPSPTPAKASSKSPR